MIANTSFLLRPRGRLLPHSSQRLLPTLAWGTFVNETNLLVLPQVQGYLQLPNPQPQTTSRVIISPPLRQGLPSATLSPGLG